ncbi:Endonuclease/exonuclease/phosphatase [Pseudomassariella vexata]|uniref:Endonuclease/exonuclease/phosphatase n=1 Tax=Pseudomassariella vexata TaxID=1141098 RepID=A0A1Y2EHT0_9PEZI|nr:Endonuclease/exonuclease/phosphatase [Pseudomassariella vexata]ORY70884.1 Endonuclease/exonuclease/phosphatase [Pseudomassariella vexata]
MPSTSRASSVTSHPSVSEPVDLATNSTHYSLSRVVQARKAQYVRPHRIRVKVGSWNVAACPGTDKDLARWFVDGRGLEPGLESHLAKLKITESDLVEESTPQEPQDEQREPSIRLVGGSDIGLYVLGLQEIMSLNLVSQSLYADPFITAKWQAALEAALPANYTLVACQQLSGLLLLIYASPEVAATISNVSTISVGTGLLGYMGNKGGISSRIMLGETTRLVFTNCHLASGDDQTNLDRRCWDYNKILSHTEFSPVNRAGVLDESGEKIGDEDFAFWFGDLNFRLDGLPGDDIRRLLMLHTRGEYDINNTSTRQHLDEDGVIVMSDNETVGFDKGCDSDGNNTPHTISRETSFDKADGNDDNAELPDPDDFIPDPHDDPASLQATLDSLLPHDQLRRTIKERKAFYEGWREGPITFLPSYKYDIGTVGLFDSSEKRRAPSWCDRILFRTRTDLQAHKQKQADEIEAKKKDEDMHKRGIDTAADDESVLFDYDPAKDSSSNDVTGGGDTVYDYDEYDEEAEESGGEDVVTKEGFKDHISLDIYTTHQRITSSDHKPIVALFTLDYDAVVPELKAKVHAEVARELDRAENEGRPGITIVVDGKESSSRDVRNAEHENDITDGSGGVDFGHVAFMQPKQRSLTIANTGRVPATISFVGKPSIENEASGSSGAASKPAEPEWLHLQLLDLSSPSDAGEQTSEQSKKGAGKAITLEPGDTALALLTLHVTSINKLRSLNQGTDSLNDVLVLCVADGRDHFIPIHGTWLPSTFGRSIEELIRIPPRNGGIRGLHQKESARKSEKDKPWKGGPIPHSLPVHSSAPAELYKLTETIETLAERAMADENMLEGEDAKLPREVTGWPFHGDDHIHTQNSSQRDQTNDSSEVDPTELRAKLIEALDTDTPLLDAFPPHLSARVRLEVTSQVLLLFFASLTDGIVSAPLWAKIETALPTLSTQTSTKLAPEIENDKTVVLDILGGAPYHNISFVFVTAMVAKVAADLVPLSPAQVQALADPSKAQGARSSSSSTDGSIDEGAIQRRLAWEKRAAEVVGTAVCRTVSGGESFSAKEKKTTEDRMRGLIEVFIRKENA